MAQLLYSELHHIHGRPLHAQGVPGIQHQGQLRCAGATCAGMEHDGILQGLGIIRHALQGEPQGLRFCKCPARGLPDPNDPFPLCRGHGANGQRTPNRICPLRLQPDLGWIAPVPEDALPAPGLLPPRQAAPRGPQKSCLPLRQMEGALGVGPRPVWRRTAFLPAGGWAEWGGGRRAGGRTGRTGR